MKRTQKLLALLVGAGITVSAAGFGASGANVPGAVRVVVENNTLSAENGAPFTGVLLDEWVNVTDSDTMVSVLTAAFSQKGCTQTGLESGYLTEVGGLTAEAGGAMGSWMITLDDWITDEGVSAYTIESGKLEAGDTIRLVYSCAWGADIGYDWSGSDTSLENIELSGGELTPAFSPDVYDYVITLSEGSESLTAVPKVKNKAYRAKTYLNTYTPAEAGTDLKAGQDIPVRSGDVLIIGVANGAWMQANYNNAEESIYRLSVQQPTVLPDVKVQETESLINAIGKVTESSAGAVKAARDAYNALTEAQQEQVSNYSLLLQAEEELAQMGDQKQIVTVDELRAACSASAPAAPEFGSEWTVITLSRMGLLTDAMKDSYLNSVKEQLGTLRTNRLSATRSTVNSGVVTALTAMGVDASDFYGYDLTAPLTDVEYVTAQGINGAVYALIALNSHPYSMTGETREALLKVLLNSQEEDGGWTIDTWSGTNDGSDADMTAMVLQALAPYVQKDDRVTKAVDAALAFLSHNQNEKGQFCSYGSYDCESSAQVLIALCELGIDPETDERFIKEGCTAYDGLISFCLEDLTFSHTENNASNALSTTQAYTAVAALYRSRNKMTALYDMSDVTLTVLGTKATDEQSSPSEQPSRNEKSDSKEPVRDDTPVPNTPHAVETGDASGLTAGVLGCLLLAALAAAAVSAGKSRQQ